MIGRFDLEVDMKSLKVKDSLRKTQGLSVAKAIKFVFIFYAFSNFCLAEYNE